MAGSNSENSKAPRHVYRELKRAGIDRKDAEQMAHDSISKRRLPAGDRPDAEETREKGGA